MAEVSGSSIPSATIAPVKPTIPTHMQNITTYATIATAEKPKGPEVKAEELPASADWVGTVVQDSVDDFVGIQQVTDGDNAPEVTDMDLAPALMDTEAIAENFVVELQPLLLVAKDDPATSDTDSIAEQPATEMAEQDAVSPIAGMSETRSDATTIAQDQSLALIPKPPKTRGPAKTETFSAFAINKQKQKEERAKAKKARKASRKVSKPSTGTLDTGKSQEVGDDLPEPEAAAETSVSKHPTNKGKTTNEKQEAEHKASESSSMAGTPETAREYPISIPNTPTPKAAAATTGSFWHFLGLLYYWYLI